MSKKVNKVAKSEAKSSSAICLKIAGCSYEGSVFGWVVKENDNKDGLDTQLTFGFNVISGCLKAIAISQSGKYLCVGGTDERIQIFHLLENKSVGELSHHTGAITSLEFFSDTHLLSGSEDSNLLIWRVHDWECVHVLGGHKDVVTGFSIHPTGMLALSVSKDSTMRLWNLVQGRLAFTRRLKKPADKVMWHPSGEHYMLLVDKEAQVYLQVDNSCVVTISKSVRINQCVFTSVDSSDTTSNSWRIAVICEDKTLSMYKFDGTKTVDIDLGLLGSGRPRDMWSGPANKTELTESSDVGIGHWIVVATSVGLMIYMSAYSLENPVDTEDDEEEEQQTEQKGKKQKVQKLNYSILGHNDLKGEPRLTAITGWTR